MITIILCLLIGSVAGILSGIFGIGAGIIMIPAMIFILGLNQHMAQGTSLAIMLPPITIFAVMEYYKNGQMDFKIAFWIALAFIFTSFFGAKIALHTDKLVLQRAFGIMMLVFAIKLIINK